MRASEILSEIWIANQASISNLSREQIGVQFSDLVGLPTLANFKSFKLKKHVSGSEITYALISDTEIIGVQKSKPPTKLLRKFPKYTDPTWRQLSNLFIIKKFRRQGLASFFYQYIIGTEGNTVISDDGQTAETIELWANRMVNAFKVTAIDLLSGREIPLNSTSEFNQNRTWIFENYRVYLIAEKA